MRIKERERMWLQSLANACSVNQADIVRFLIDFAHSHADALSGFVLSSALQPAQEDLPARQKAKRQSAGRPPLAPDERLALVYIGVTEQQGEWMQTLSETWGMKQADVTRWIIEFALKHADEVEQHALSRSGDDETTPG